MPRPQPSRASATVEIKANPATATSKVGIHVFLPVTVSTYSRPSASGKDLFSRSQGAETRAGLEWFPPFPKFFVIQVSPNDLSVATHYVHATAIVAAPRVCDPVPSDTLFNQSLTGLRLDGIGGYAVGSGT